MAACQGINSKLVLIVNTAFINYLDKFSNLTESLEFPNIKNKTTFEQILPISLNITKFDSTLLTASSDLKEFIHWYTNDKEFFDLQERHDSLELSTNKISFLKVFINRHFSVHYCDNFFTGYNFDSVFIM